MISINFIQPCITTILTIFCYFRHPNNMAKNLIRLLFNLGNVIHFTYIIFFVYGVIIPGHRHYAFGGEWKFLTHWNIWLQLIYFLVGLCNEIFGSNEKHANTNSVSSVQKLRDFIFSTLAFPLGIFITISFWSLYLTDRNLVFPPKLDQFYPLWANHMLHTTCAVSQLIEMIISFHSYPSRTKGMLTSMCFVFVYLGWVLFIAYKSNVWVYPILQKLPTYGRTIFIGGCSLLFGILFFGGEILNGKIWSAELKTMNPLKEESTIDANTEEPATHNYNTRSRKKVAKAD